MFWPRMVLTPGEVRSKQTKYFDRKTGRRGVLRKIYGGQLELTETIRQPQFSFAIARRVRVFALTASGDIGQFKIQINDSSGENYLAQPVSLPALLGGYAELPPPAYGTSTEGPTGGYPPLKDSEGTLGWTYAQGVPQTYAPLVFEPNIVLDSNQVLNVLGFPLAAYESVNYRVDLCLHVWEFPAWQNGPA